MPDYESMTNDQLEAENQRLWETRVEAKKEQLKIKKILDERYAKEEVRKKVEGMSDAEKAELKQVLSNVGGIKSEAEVGEPGAE